jgi:hypothetical protein
VAGKRSIAAKRGSDSNAKITLVQSDERNIEDDRTSLFEVPYFSTKYYNNEA